VPGRSDNPSRYRDAIVAAAKEILRSCSTDPGSPPEFDAALAGLYPEWFAAHGISPNTRHQRLRRGRDDVRDVLRAIVSRADLTMS
jgi:hypothetical protein